MVQLIKSFLLKGGVHPRFYSIFSYEIGFFVGF
jgi:hypothetical protein